MASARSRRTCVRTVRNVSRAAAIWTSCQGRVARLELRDRSAECPEAYTCNAMCTHRGPWRRVRKSLLLARDRVAAHEPRRDGVLLFGRDGEALAERAEEI